MLLFCINRAEIIHFMMTIQNIIVRETFWRLTDYCVLFIYAMVIFVMLDASYIK